MMRYAFLPVIGLLLLSGCNTTTSFAPPPVRVSYLGTGETSGTICPRGGRSQQAITVERNVAGAYKLIDTFVESYRCAAHSAANGRQAFELPAFVATSGAALASALGGGATYGIVGTGASSAFNAGKSYWDPRLKAGIYDHALDALLCIKTEAVGIPAYQFENAAAEQIKLWSNMGTGQSKVSVPVEQQYFEMVSAAAFSVERILAQRLSTMAPVDAAAVAAELTAVIEELKAKENGGSTTDDASGDGEGADDADPADALGPFFRMQVKSVRQAKSETELDLEVLKPKLDKCVIRAKL